MDTLTCKKGCIPILSFKVSVKKIKGAFHKNVRVNEVLRPVYNTVTVKVYHCANDEGPFDRQIGFRTHSVCQCKFDGDCDGDGNGTCKRTFNVEWHKVVGNGANPVSSSSSSHFFTHYIILLLLLTFFKSCSYYKPDTLNIFMNGVGRFMVSMVTRCHGYCGCYATNCTLFL